MIDQEVISSQLKADRFPFQSEGDITLAGPQRELHVRSGDVAHHHEARRAHSRTPPQRYDRGTLCG